MLHRVLAAAFVFPQTWFILISRRLRHYVECRGQYFQFFAMQGQYLTVHHYVHGRIQIELDSPGGFALSHRMFDMRSVVQPGQIPDQTKPPNRSPSDILHKTVIDLSLRSNHHRAPGELAVVERKEQTRAVVE